MNLEAFLKFLVLLKMGQSWVLPHFLEVTVVELFLTVPVSMYSTMKAAVQILTINLTHKNEQPLPANSFLKIHQMKRQIDDRDSGDSEESDREDDEKIAQRNLLEIRSSLWHGNSSSEVQETDVASQTNSILALFEPKFREIFSSYCSAMGNTIVLTTHLMALCLEHLITFSCWCRESNNRCVWIRNILEENADLRPEVRNGMAMILIYSFSAAKAHSLNSDMFTVLQDLDSGLGIVNKTSLKVYNDPFFYFAFLKSCISGLIDTGRIPGNERWNQPKKPKRQSENKEELASFLQLKTLVVALLVKGENSLCRAKVQHVITLWQSRTANIRSNRFAAAVKTVSSISSTEIGERNILPSDSSFLGFERVNTTNALSGAGALVELSSSSASLQGMEATGLTALLYDGPHMMTSALMPMRRNGSALDTGESAAVSASGRSLKTPAGPGLFIADILSTGASIEGTDAYISADTLSSAVAVSSTHSTGPSPVLSHASAVRCLQCLHFERIATKAWTWAESHIYDFLNFISNCSSTNVYLIDEGIISSEEFGARRLVSKGRGLISLRQEMDARGALLAAWNPTELPQLKGMLLAWAREVELSHNNISIKEFWIRSSSTISRSRCGKDSASDSSEIGSVSTKAQSLGILAIENYPQIGIVVRNHCDDVFVGMENGCWRTLFRDDLVIGENSFAGFLSNFFPQLRQVINAAEVDPSTILVKQFTHSWDPKDGMERQGHPPPEASPQCYQTMGTMDEPASSFFDRLCNSQQHTLFYDFILWPISNP